MDKPTNGKMATKLQKPSDKPKNAQIRIATTTEEDKQKVIVSRISAVVFSIDLIMILL
tara:strand:- start:28 stop:201 length:174 start_codon:yes stop_codon:yes gene_type:complete